MSHTSEISIPYGRKLADAAITTILARLVLASRFPCF